MSTQENTSALPMKLDVRAFPFAEPKGNLLGFASVNISDCFAVGGIKVMNGENGLFIAMPSMKDSKGEYRDVCFPTTSDFRKELQKAVLDEYHASLEKPSVKEKIQDTAREAKSRPPKAAHPLGEGER